MSRSEQLLPRFGEGSFAYIDVTIDPGIRFNNVPRSTDFLNGSVDTRLHTRWFENVLSSRRTALWRGNVLRLVALKPGIVTQCH